MRFILVAVFYLPTLFLSISAAAVSQSEDPYEILGVSASATDEELAEAWKRLMKVHHPDSGGDVTAAQIVSEAYQFLKADRIDYDRGILPFRGQFRTSPRMIPYSADEQWRYQFIFLKYLRQENKAREMAGGEKHPVFVHYAMMNMAGDHVNYKNFKSSQLRAYSELLAHLKLLKLNRSEIAGFALHDPVEALQAMLEHYDNFSIRFYVLADIFMAYEEFYLRDEDKSKAFLSLIERLHTNGLIYDRRFAAPRELVVKSLRAWLEYYFESPKVFRLQHRDQYLRTRKLLLRLEPFPRSARTCFYLLLGIVK